jgi:hypothetical protein
VPTVVTAQARRDGRRQARLARALRDCRPEALDDELARRAGELCGPSDTSDVVDAIVIQSAASRGDDIYTGDARDLEHLADRLTLPVVIVPIGN